MKYGDYAFIFMGILKNYIHHIKLTDFTDTIIYNGLCFYLFIFN